MSVSLAQFIETHGKAIGDKIEQELTPVYNPDKSDTITESFDEKIDSLLRAPFPVQKEVIKGLSKAMYYEGRKKLFICGEMGTGKTMLGLSVIAMSPRPMRSLIVCPGHLVNKWIRESRTTIPGVKTVDLAVKNVISILDKVRSEKTPLQNHEIWVISKERVKLSCGWQAAYAQSRRSEFPRCPDCGEIPQGKDDEWLTLSVLHRRKLKCHCGSPLWQSIPKPRRYAPMEFIKRYLKGKLDMVILDEIHDYKAGNTLQGHAMGILASCTPYFLGLTGTLNGGYADNLFYLLYRLEPNRLSDFGHRGSEKWQKAYGVIEEVQKLEDEDHRYGRVKRNNVMVRKRPGVSPEVIGRYFLDKSCFIRLADVIDGLPSYDETVITVDMEQQGTEYSVLEAKLQDAVKRYKTKATGAMLQALLSYPDSCVSFPEHIEIKGVDKNTETMQVLETITAPKIDGSKLLPKERELIDLAKKEIEQGRKFLVYVTFTGSRDIRPRLKEVLEADGFRVGILSEKIEPKKREAWINNNAHSFDVLISNPELVKVGLDLIQFPTIVFYQAGYNIFTLRQAARRSWRIGQPQPVRIFFMAYKNTMQEAAISLIAKKLEVALLVEGDLPEGLAEYQIQGGSLVEEMTKALVEGRRYSGAEAAWANFRKKEIEANLGMGSKETIFTENTSKKSAKSPSSAKISVIDNTIVTVTVMEGKRKRSATLTVKYDEIDNVLKGKVAQFALF
jgi:SNF2 family DNA or RNA helicase